MKCFSNYSGHEYLQETSNTTDLYHKTGTKTGLCTSKCYTKGYYADSQLVC